TMQLGRAAMRPMSKSAAPVCVLRALDRKAFYVRYYSGALIISPTSKPILIRSHALTHSQAHTLSSPNSDHASVSGMAARILDLMKSIHAGPDRLLSEDGLVDTGLNIIAGPIRSQQIGFIGREETIFEFPIRRETNTVAGGAEWIAHRAYNSETSGVSVNLVIAGCEIGFEW